MSRLCLKQVGFSPSSRQHLVVVSPLTPAPTTTTLIPAVSAGDLGCERGLTWEKPHGQSPQSQGAAAGTSSIGDLSVCHPQTLHSLYQHSGLLICKLD